MRQQISDPYMITQVLTGSPAKLRLLLIEAALKLANRTREQMTNAQWNDAVETCIHCQDIVTELITSPHDADDAPLARRVRDLYLFVHRTLVAATVERSAPKLAEAITILEIERETWREVAAATARPRLTPHLSFDSTQPTTSLSLEA